MCVRVCVFLYREAAKQVCIRLHLLAARLSSARPSSPLLPVAPVRLTPTLLRLRLHPPLAPPLARCLSSLPVSRLRPSKPPPPPSPSIFSVPGALVYTLAPAHAPIHALPPARARSANEVLSHRQTRRHPRTLTQTDAHSHSRTLTPICALSPARARPLGTHRAAHTATPA